MYSTLAYEKLGEFSSSLGFPIEDEGTLNVVSNNGDVYTYQGGDGFKVVV